MTLEVGGDKGMAIYNGSTVSKRTLATEGKLVDVALCPAVPSPVEQFLTGNILDGFGIEEAKALTHLMVEAYK